MQSDATWSVDAPTVVEVVADGEPILRALAPGTATVTATVGAFTAQTSVTVVGQTIAFTPGTTRWLVQAAPGHTLERVIYTHQTSPDVPEAVLVESVDGAADHFVLRGVSDGATTSITPVSGPVPIQTMGDSFGGVILAQGTATEPTTLQRVGFTPEVMPWRWESGGTLTGIVQIHDGTLFATERVRDGNGTVTAAAVVVVDGATGTPRARVPVTTSDYFHGLLDDGSTNCDAALDTLEGIGLSDQWALTTADVYGVVVFDREVIHFDCGPRDTGHLIAAQHLLNVDRDGASTMTLLSQRTETYPETQAALATPEATALAADARGNFVVTFGNERELFGPVPGVAIQPLGEYTLVGYDGTHADSDGQLLSVKSFDGQLIWTAQTSGRPLAFGTDETSVVVLDGTAVGEIGPGASSPSMAVSADVVDIALQYEDHWQITTGTALLSVSGQTASNAIIRGSQKGKQQQSPLQTPLCGELTDPRTEILGQYTHYKVGWQPKCEDFTHTVPGASHYQLGAARQTGTWNTSNTHDWAILAIEMVSNVACLVNANGSVPALNSGYRTPFDQVRISGTPKKWANANHVYGLAADLDVLNANGYWGEDKVFVFVGPDPGAPAWDALKALAKEGACGVACVEPRNISPGHFHVDYRPAPKCPAVGW